MGAIVGVNFICFECTFFQLIHTTVSISNSCLQHVYQRTQNSTETHLYYQLNSLSFTLSANLNHPSKAIYFTISRTNKITFVDTQFSHL